MDMKNELITLLNRVLSNELVATRQSMAHGDLCRNWGELQISEKQHAQAVGEMRHADSLAECIASLGGAPCINWDENLKIGEELKEQLRYDRELGNSTLRLLHDGVALCKKGGYDEPRKILEQVLESQQRYGEWLDATLEELPLDGLVGQGNYKRPTND